MSLASILVACVLILSQVASTSAAQVEVGAKVAQVAGGYKLHPMKRLAVRGRVRDRKGELWRGVRVVLVSNPVPGAAPRMPDFAASDVVEAVSGERGAFRALLIPGRSYSAWGVTEFEEGRFRSTRVVEEVVAGIPITLNETTGPRVEQRIRIEGGSAWKAWGPLRYRLRAAGRNELVLEGAIEDGQQLTIPPTGGNHVQVEVLTRAGLPLVAGLLSFKGRSAEEQAQVTSLRIHPPATTPMKVSDAAGATIADARITWKHRTHAIEVGRTGRDGLAQITLPQNKLDRYLVLTVHKPGHADLVYTGPQGSTQKPIAVVLQPGVSIKGRLLLAGGKPAAHMPLLIHGSEAYASGGFYMDVFPRVFRTDESGRFEIAGLHPDCPPMITAVPLGQHRAGLDWDTRFPLAPTILLHANGNPLGSGIDLGDLELNGLTAIDVTIRDHRRLLIADAEVAIVDASQTKTQRTFMPVFQRVNRLGRLRLLANLQGMDARVVALANGALIHRPVAKVENRARAGADSLDVAHRKDTPIELELTAPEPLFVQGTLSDSLGEPIAGARIRIQPNRMLGHPLANWNQEPWLRHLFSVMIWPRSTTNAKGHYRVVAPLHPATLEVTTAIQGKTGRFSERQIVNIDKRNVLLDLRMPRTRADMELGR